jgi:hypothetical protein
MAKIEHRVHYFMSLALKYSSKEIAMETAPH